VILSILPAGSALASDPGPRAALDPAAAATGDGGDVAIDQHQAEGPRRRLILSERPDGSIVIGERTFASWLEYVRSDFFRANNLRCGTPQVDPAAFGDDGVLGGGGVAGGSSSDCSASFTNPAGIYAPSVVLYRIPVVVHVIRASNGVTGNLSMTRINSQIQVLNEDFNAIAGTNGGNGTNTRIEFYLATADENGVASTGVTYHNNDTWFNDGGSYWNTIAANWDPNRFLNLYTNNTASLGYTPFLPQTGSPGASADRVVIYYQAFGVNAAYAPYHLGRTATHEIGHYLGLYHTFGACGTTSPPGCYSSGDVVCDTNAHSSAQFGCPINTQCGDGTDPYRNYLNYTDDSCMQLFTPEQARRMRCTLEHYRPLLYDIGEQPPVNDLCADALNVGDGTTPFTNEFAATDGPDEPSQCSSGGDSNVGCDIWYKYTASCDGVVTLNLCGSQYDTKVAVYDGACPVIASAIACNDDSNVCGAGSTRSHLTFNAVNGATYRIRIGGFKCAVGDGTIGISCAAVCVGDCLDQDGDVDVNDLLSLLAFWGAVGTCDLDEDGAITVSDLLILLANWGPC
jgi:hypothetical protein